MFKVKDSQTLQSTLKKLQLYCKGIVQHLAGVILKCGFNGVIISKDCSEVLCVYIAPHHEQTNIGGALKSSANK